MPTPSLLIVPARFKSGKLYSQIPTSGAGDFTVTRATSATRVNASGLIEVQKTNLFLQSAGFEVSGNWSPTSTTVTTGSTTAFTAPDNSTDADLITATGSGSSFIGQNTTIASGTYTISVFAKAGNYGLFRIGNVLSAARAAWFNLNAGVVTGTVNGGTASMQNYGNGWYRCIYTSSGMVSGNTFFAPSDAPNSTNAVSGSSIYFWGAQLEEGLSASEYIPTTTIARTRFAGVTVDGTVATNIPRLDYFASGGTVGCPALLVEPSGSNLALRSNEFRTIAEGGPSNSWTANDTVIISVNNLSPDGTNNATRIRGATTPTNRARQQVITGTSGVAYVGSAWIRRVSGTSPITLRVGDAGSTTNISPTSTWQRFSFSSTPTTTTVRIGFVFPNDTDEFEIWGAQLETGSIATSYIPTTTGSVTRNADVVSVSGAVSGSIGQTEGTIYAEVDVRSFVSSAARRIVNLRVDGSNLLSLEMNSAGNQFDFVATSGGVSVAASASGITTGVYKIAVGYNSAASGTVLYVNGVLRDTKTISIPNLSAAVFGLGVRADGAAGTQLNDRIRAAALYTTRLTNAELAAITQL